MLDYHLYYEPRNETLSLDYWSFSTAAIGRWCVYASAGAKSFLSNALGKTKAGRPDRTALACFYS